MADILIRGMEMPRQGLKVVAIHSNGHVYADTSDPGFLHKIADVIELPEHGDLIDKDEAYARWNKGEEDVLHNAPVIVPAEREEPHD